MSICYRITFCHHLSCCVLAVLAFSLLTSLSVLAGELWTVQAVDTGKEKTCDAFASGAQGRPLYEFRFRRTGSSLLLIVSYNGAAVPRFETATIRVDGALVGTLPATAGTFGKRKAIIISLDPASVDLAELETKRSLEISVSGQTFRVAMWASDQIAANMQRCLAFIAGR